MNRFTIIDTQTGKRPDAENIIRTEAWAKHLTHYGIDCFCIDEDGTLGIIDGCGNVSWCPEGRFRVVWDGPTAQEGGVE